MSPFHVSQVERAEEAGFQMLVVAKPRADPGGPAHVDTTPGFFLLTPSRHWDGHAITILVDAVSRSPQTAAAVARLFGGDNPAGAVPKAADRPRMYEKGIANAVKDVFRTDPTVPLSFDESVLAATKTLREAQRTDTDAHMTAEAQHTQPRVGTRSRGTVLEYAPADVISVLEQRAQQAQADASLIASIRSKLQQKARQPMAAASHGTGTAFAVRDTAAHFDRVLRELLEDAQQRLKRAEAVVAAVKKPVDAAARRDGLVLYTDDVRAALADGPSTLLTRARVEGVLRTVAAPDPLAAPPAALDGDEVDAYSVAAATLHATVMRALHAQLVHATADTATDMQHPPQRGAVHGEDGTAGAGGAATVPAGRNVKLDFGPLNRAFAVRLPSTGEKLAGKRKARDDDIADVNPDKKERAAATHAGPYAVGQIGMTCASISLLQIIAAVPALRHAVMDDAAQSPPPISSGALRDMLEELPRSSRGFAKDRRRDAIHAGVGRLLHELDLDITQHLDLQELLNGVLRSLRHDPTSVVYRSFVAYREGRGHAAGCEGDVGGAFSSGAYGQLSFTLRLTAQVTETGGLVHTGSGAVALSVTDDGLMLDPTGAFTGAPMPRLADGETVRTWSTVLDSPYPMDMVTDVQLLNMATWDANELQTGCQHCAAMLVYAVYREEGALPPVLLLTAQRVGTNKLRIAPHSVVQRVHGAHVLGTYRLAAVGLRFGDTPAWGTPGATYGHWTVLVAYNNVWYTCNSGDSSVTDYTGHTIEDIFLADPTAGAAATVFVYELDASADADVEVVMRVANTNLAPTRAAAAAGGDDMRV